MSGDQSAAASVREQFVQTVENKILSGEWPVGKKLPPTRELHALMGVSLTTVTAGITELCSKGFLEVKPRHGTYVADYIRNGTPETLFALFRYNGGNLNPREIRSFTECRLALDLFVLKLAAQRASDEQLRALAEDVGRIRACEDMAEACELVTLFYGKIYQMSGNTVFTLMYRTTVEVQKGIYFMYFQKNGMDSVKASASELYEALLRRDHETACAVAIISTKSVLSGPRAIVQG